MLEEVSFIRFLSFYTVWFDYSFLANRDGKSELGQTLQGLI